MGCGLKVTSVAPHYETAFSLNSEFAADFNSALCLNNFTSGRTQLSMPEIHSGLEVCQGFPCDSQWAQNAIMWQFGNNLVNFSRTREYDPSFSLCC